MCTCMAKFNSAVYSLSLVLFTGHTHTSKSTDCWPNGTHKCVYIIIIPVASRTGNNGYRNLGQG